MYKPGNIDNWSGRIDELDGADGLRIHQVIQPLDLDAESPAIPDSGKHNFALLGFACDEGVRRNKGRTGAAEGPFELRKALANLAVHFDSDLRLYDAGDVICLNEDMEAAQALLAQQVQKLHSQRIFPLLVGGGHEIAYGHFKGITAAHPDLSVGIINIDAHFDLRNYSEKGNSGTPFLQIARDCQKSGREFSYLVCGIQQASNTRALFKTADQLGVQFVTAEEWQRDTDKTVMAVEEFLSRHDAVYLTICLDVVAAPFAPGVSAPALNGVFPKALLNILNRIMSAGKMISFDMAELNPKYDLDGRTARLAAYFIWNLVTHFSSSHS